MIHSAVLGSAKNSFQSYDEVVRYFAWGKNDEYFATDSNGFGRTDLLQMVTYSENIGFHNVLRLSRRKGDFLSFKKPMEMIIENLKRTQLVSSLRRHGAEDVRRKLAMSVSAEVR